MKRRSFLRLSLTVIAAGVLRPVMPGVAALVENKSPFESHMQAIPFEKTPMMWVSTERMQQWKARKNYWEAFPKDVNQREKEIQKAYEDAINFK